MERSPWNANKLLSARGEVGVPLGCPLARFRDSCLVPNQSLSFGIPILPTENMRWTRSTGVGYAGRTGCKAALDVGSNRGRLRGKQVADEKATTARTDAKLRFGVFSPGGRGGALRAGCAGSREAATGLSASPTRSGWTACLRSCDAPCADHFRVGDPRPRLMVGRRVKISTVFLVIKWLTPSGSARSFLPSRSADRLGCGRSRT
jgi:hypothetical protein